MSAKLPCPFCGNVYEGYHTAQGCRLEEKRRRGYPPHLPPDVVALTCSDCGSGGKAEQDGCLMPVPGIEALQAGRPAWEEVGR